MQVEFFGSNLLVKTITVNTSSLSMATPPPLSYNSSFIPSPALFTLSPSVLYNGDSNNGGLISVLFTEYHVGRYFHHSVGDHLASCIFDVTLRGAPLVDGLQFTIVPVNFSKTKKYRCVYFTDDSTWASHGITTTTTDSGVTAHSTHLTNFAVMVVSIE